MCSGMNPTDFLLLAKYLLLTVGFLAYFIFVDWLSAVDIHHLYIVLTPVATTFIDYSGSLVLQ